MRSFKRRRWIRSCLMSVHVAAVVAALLAVLPGAVFLAAPRLGEAQQAAQIPRIGVLIAP